MCGCYGTCSSCAPRPPVRPDTRDMRTNALVLEFTAARVRDALSATGASTAEHRRHVAVVDELRKRGVLD